MPGSAMSVRAQLLSTRRLELGDDVRTDIRFAGHFDGRLQGSFSCNAGGAAMLGELQLVATTPLTNKSHYSILMFKKCRPASLVCRRCRSFLGSSNIFPTPQLPTPNSSPRTAHVRNEINRASAPWIPLPNIKLANAFDPRTPRTAELVTCK